MNREKKSEEFNKYIVCLFRDIDKKIKCFDSKCPYQFCSVCFSKKIGIYEHTTMRQKGTIIIILCDSPLLELQTMVAAVACHYHFVIAFAFAFAAFVVVWPVHVDPFVHFLLTCN